MKPRSVNASILERLTRNSTPGILCGLVILILTGIPGSYFPHVKPVFGVDKVVHVLMYACFAFLCVWGYRKQFTANGIAYKRKALAWTCIISILYGGLTEVMQEYLITTRHGDWRDFIADIIGTFLGLAAFHLFFRKKK